MARGPERNATPASDGRRTSEDAPTRAKPLVVLEYVNKRFGDLHVLKDIDLTVHEQEVVVVIGPSGSGKSTLCRTINRLEPIDDGTITLDGEPLPAEGRGPRPHALRRRDGLQSFNLFSHRTVLQSVTVGPIKVRRMRRAEADERARRLLDRVGVADQESKFPAQLSGASREPARAGRQIYVFYNNPLRSGWSSR